MTMTKRDYRTRKRINWFIWGYSYLIIIFLSTLNVQISTMIDQYHDKFQGWIEDFRIIVACGLRRRYTGSMQRCTTKAISGIDIIDLIAREKILWEWKEWDFIQGFEWILLSIDRHSNKERLDEEVFQGNYHRHRRYSCRRETKYLVVLFIPSIFSMKSFHEKRKHMMSCVCCHFFHWSYSRAMKIK